MHTSKSFKALILGAAAAAAISGQALANTITVFDVSTTGAGPYTWTYGASHSNGRIFADEGLIVIYDFAGFIPGSNTQPANWTFGSSNVGSPSTTVDALAGVFSVDDPTLPNLCWKYTGPLITDGKTTTTQLGLFTADSIYNAPREDRYGTQDRGLSPLGVSASQGPILVPTKTSDTGSSLVFLGTALLAVGGLRRKLAK